MFGQVNYVYSTDKLNGYTSDIPTEAGIYYVKATVDKTDYYSALESTPVEFKIVKTPVIVDPEPGIKPIEKPTGNGVVTANNVYIMGFVLCLGLSFIGIAYIVKKETL